MTNYGLLLCRIQAELFENYGDFSKTSPYFFIVRFMNSNLAKRFDDTTVLLEVSSPQSMIEELNEQYGKTSFGKSDSVSKDILYWVGYIYRYWSFVYEVPSKILVNHVHPNKLIKRYSLYHSMDPLYAINRIAEEEHVLIHPQKTLLELLENLSKNK